MKVIVTTSAFPFHYGHLELYKEAIDIFQEENVSVAIGRNASKNIDFNKIIFHLAPYNIKYVIAENITLADFCAINNISYLIRGIRNSIDAEYELKLDFLNKEINPKINTIFFPTKDIFSNISSTSINELLSYQKFDVVKKYMNEDAMYRFFYTKPKFIVFFGKSCLGKSTFLNNRFGKENVANLDEIFWDIFKKIHGEKKYQEIREESKNIVFSKDKSLKDLINKYSTIDFWKQIFDYIENNYINCEVGELSDLNFQNNKLFLIDFASIGNYWHTIPSYLRGMFYLVKLTNTEENRIKYTKNKNFENKIDLLDKNYLEVDYFDKEINLENMK